jgi:DNA-binding transcriptional regulator PaaX
MEAREWIILNYTLPKEPSRVRVSIWRKLKKQGSVSIGQSMWILPYSPEHTEFFNELSTEIGQNSGAAYLLKSTFIYDKSSDEIIGEFNKARNDEYSEVLEKCADFFHEIEKEVKRENFTFAEIEENEYELNKLMDWFKDIAKRDFFTASNWSVVEQELNKCRQELENFSRKTYEVNHQII